MLFSIPFTIDQYPPNAQDIPDKRTHSRRDRTHAHAGRPPAQSNPRLQRTRIPAASAEALLQRMLDKIEMLCAERERLKKEQPGPMKRRVLGGRRW